MEPRDGRGRTPPAGIFSRRRLQVRGASYAARRCDRVKSGMQGERPGVAGYWKFALGRSREPRPGPAPAGRAIVTFHERRRMLGVCVRPSEAEIHWRGFLERLVACGLRDVEFIASEDHAGARAVRQELKRRAAKVMVFPKEDALLQSVSAILVRIDKRQGPRTPRPASSGNARMRDPRSTIFPHLGLLDQGQQTCGM